MARFAYSYDREDYTGSFATPEEAVAEATKRSEGLSSPPTEIFVAQLVEADPQAHDHAQRIVESMSQRAHVDFGDPARKYLKQVPPKLVKELDEAIAQTILGWLRKHDLMPTFVSVRDIRAFPVLTPESRVGPRGTNGEVHDLGSESGY